MIHPLRAYPRLVEIESINDERPKIHLGCGDYILPSWRNVDLYEPKADCRRELWDIENLGKFDIAYSCHALEHVGYEEGIKCLMAWYHSLNAGGSLYLCIPDVEGICENFKMNTEWFMRCLYGLQTNPGHFHKWGYTDKSISYALKVIGFKVMIVEKMSYGNTPSLWIEAVK